MYFVYVAPYKALWAIGQIQVTEQMLKRLTVKQSVRLNKFSYMLRGWEASQPSGRDPPVWRFSLEDPYTGVRRGFANFDELIFYLESLFTSDGSVGCDE